MKHLLMKFELPLDQMEFLFGLIASEETGAYLEYVKAQSEIGKEQALARIEMLNSIKQRMRNATSR